MTGERPTAGQTPAYWERSRTPLGGDLDEALVANDETIRVLRESGVQPDIESDVTQEIPVVEPERARRLGEGITEVTRHIDEVLNLMGDPRQYQNAPGPGEAI